MKTIDMFLYGPSLIFTSTYSKSRYLLLWTVWTFFLPDVQEAAKNVVIIESFEIVDTPTLKMVANITRPTPTSTPAIFVKIELLHDASQLMLNGVFTVRSRAGELQAALYNRSIGVCEFLNQPFRNRLLEIIYLELINHSNIPNRCPIPTGLYYIRNVSFAKARIPSFLPASYFRVDINMLSTKPPQKLLASQWYGKLIKK